MLKKILTNSFFYFVTTALIKFSMLILSILLARFSGKDIFGQFMSIRSTTAMLELFSLFGMNQIAIKCIAENKDDEHKIKIIFNNILLISIISASFFSLLLFFFSNYISLFFFNSNDIQFVSALEYGAFLLFISSLSVILSSILNGFEEYKLLSLSNVYAVILFILPSIYLIKEYKLVGSIWAITLFFFLSVIIKIFLLKKNNLLHLNYSFFQFDFDKILVMLKLAVPTFFSILLIIPVFWYSKTILVSTTNGFSEIAIFEASYQWLTIILVITGAVTNISIPLFSKLLKKKLKKDLKYALLLNIIINILISLGFTIIFLYFGNRLLGIYGDGYENLKLLSILLYSSIPFTSQAIINRFFISITKVWYNFYLSFIWSLSYLGYIFYIFKISTITAVDLAEAFLLSYCLIFILSIAIIIKYFFGKEYE